MARDKPAASLVNEKTKQQVLTYFNVTVVTDVIITGLRQHLNWAQIYSTAAMPTPNPWCRIGRLVF